MTRSYVRPPQRDTRPLLIARRVRPDVLDDRVFQCFRLVPTSDGLQPVEVVRSRSRMHAFVGL